MKVVYEGVLKSSLADFDAMVEFDQTWFIFQHSLPCGPHTSSIGVYKCGLFFNIVSPVVHTLLPSLLQRLDSHGIDALILIFGNSPQLQIWPHHQSNTASQPSVFFHVGEQKMVRWCEIRRIRREINQFKATVTHSSHCNHRLVCRNIIQVKQDSLRQFSRPFLNVSRNTIQSPELLNHCGFIWKETMQLVSRKVEFNACQVSLMWHNSFLVSLWTFQPTLVKL